MTLSTCRLRSEFRCLACCLLGLGVARALNAQMTERDLPSNQVTHMHIRVPASPRNLPDTLFGSFLEPIGHSTYGGLWADVVENPSFEEGLWSAGHVADMLRERPSLRRASELGLPLPWEPLDDKQGNRYLAVRGDAGNSVQSVLLMSLPGKETGVKQRVYLPVARTLNYRGKLMLKHVRGNTTVRVSLRQHMNPEQELASVSLDAGAETWSAYSFSLSLADHQVARLEPVDLVVSIRDDARAQVDSVSLFPADAVDGMDPDVLSMARELESPVIRFGGNFTSAYHWQDGIGDPDKRVSMVNPSWGIPEYNTFGTDEFLRFCELVHAQPQIALNLGTGTPQEAAEWVRYVDSHWAKHDGGLLWELGNELWGDFQIGYPSKERVAAVTLATSQAIRAVDPHARLIATGGDEDFFPDWNAQQLTSPKGSFDFLSTHFVVNDRTQYRGDDGFRTMASLALPWGLAERMHSIQKQAATAGHTEVRVAFTEWLMVSDNRNGPNFDNLGGGLFAGGFLNMVMRNSDVVSISDMTGILEFGGIWKKRAQVYGAPAYWVLREYAHAHPRRLLELTTDTPTYSISHGITRLPEIKEVPYLDCVASEPEDALTLIVTCVNRHLVRPLPAVLDLANFKVKDGSVNLATLQGDSVLSTNDETSPDRIHPLHETLHMKGSSFEHTFPNASVTILTIPLRK